ncbi:MAG: Arm DNA-binding domain-containing protein, partial [Ginsengibacter sp.]
MANSFSLLFHLRKPKGYKSGPLPIYLRITVDGKRG